MWTNVTLNVIIKNYASLNYRKPRGDVFLFPFFFLHLFPPHSEDPSVKYSHFSCFGSRHRSTFWAKCHNGFYWSLMSGALSDAKVTMLSAFPNRIYGCCDSRAFRKRAHRRSILPKNCAFDFHRLVEGYSEDVISLYNCDAYTPYTFSSTCSLPVLSSHILYLRCRKTEIGSLAAQGIVQHFQKQTGFAS